MSACFTILLAACGGNSPNPDAKQAVLPDAAATINTVPDVPDFLAVDTLPDVAIAPSQNPDSSPDQLSEPDAASPDSVIVQCRPGQTRESYSGPSITSRVGICLSRLEVCDQTGMYVVERDEVLPQTEIPWDGIDQDCNGTDLECPIYADVNAADADLV